MPSYEGGGYGGSKKIEDVIDYINRLDRNMSYLMGQLDTENIREVGGWRIEPGLIRSKDFDVGMSTDDSTFNPVRFFAGGRDKDFAPWRVHQDGTMFAVGATLVSQDSLYPRIELGGNSHLFTGYSSATEYIQLNAYNLGEHVPTLGFFSGAQNTYMMQYPGQGFVLKSTGSIAINPGGFFGTLYLGGIVDVGDFASVVTSSGSSLQDALDNLQSQISGKSSIGHTHTVTTDTGTYTTSS